MKTVYIVHGCPSDREKAMDPARRTYDKNWLPWTEQQLVAQGYKVVRPLMPEPWAPDYQKFKAAFEQNEFTDEDIFIGHSCGCAFLTRWLGETGRKAKKLILVAPWKIAYRPDGSDKEYYGFEINQNLKTNVGEIVMFTSDTEKEDGKRSLVLYQEALGGRVISLKNHGHYTEGDMGTAEFPELLEVIKR